MEVYLNRATFAQGLNLIMGKTSLLYMALWIFELQSSHLVFLTPCIESKAGICKSMQRQKWGMQCRERKKKELCDLGESYSHGSL